MRKLLILSFLGAMLTGFNGYAAEGQDCPLPDLPDIKVELPEVKLPDGVQLPEMPKLPDLPKLPDIPHVPCI